MADLKFNIEANASPAQKSVSGLGSEVEELAGGLLKVVQAAEAAGKSTDEIAKGFSSGLGIPIKEAREMVVEFQSALQDAADTGTQATGQVAEGFQQIQREVKSATSAGLSEFRTSTEFELGEVKSAASRFRGTIGKALNFGEDLANSSVDITNFGSATRSTLANIASVIGSAGPAGIVGALALAAGSLGLGALTAGIDEADKHQKELNARASEMGKLYISAANGSASALDAIVDKLQELATSTDAGVVNLRDLRDVADSSGSNFRDLAQAYAGNTQGLDSLIRKAQDAKDALDFEASDITLGATEISRLNTKSDAQGRYVQYLKDAQEVARQAAEDQDNFERSGGQALLDRQEAIERVQQAQADRLSSDKAHIDEVAGAWQNAATDASNYFAVNDEGVTEFDWMSYLTNAEETLAAANEYKQKILGVPEDIRAEGERIFADQGAQAALQYTNAYILASDSDRGRFEAAAAANGDAAGRAAADALTSGLSTLLSKYIPPEFVVKARVDDSELRNYRPSNKTAYVDYKAAQTAWDKP